MMAEQMAFDPNEWAHARRTDPETSHAAAASMTSDKLAAQRALVYDALKRHGPMTDTDILRTVQLYFDKRHESPSGLRTRRSELVRMGLVEDTGGRMRLDSGRKAIVWRAIER